MKIDLLHESEFIEYDDLVACSDEGTIFQTSWWQNITDKAYGSSFSTERHGYTEDDVLVAAIPISSYQKFGQNFVFRSKFTPYLGPIFSRNPDMKIIARTSWQKSLNSEFAKILKDTGICVTYPFGPAHNDLQPFQWAGFSIGVYYHYVLDIDDLSTVEMNFDKQRRKGLRRAYKSGLEIKCGKINDFINLYNETLTRQKHSLFPSELLETIYRESKARGCGEVFTAHDDNGPVGSLLLVWDNKRSYRLASGITTNSKNANTLLTWETIKFTKQGLNLDQYNFLGSNIPSIEYYMRQFGGMLRPRYYIYEKCLRRDLLMALRSRLVFSPTSDES